MQRWHLQPGRAGRAGQGQPAGFWAEASLSCLQHCWGLTVSLSGSQWWCSLGCREPGMLFWECDGALEGWQQLKLQPLGVQALFLPSDDKAGFRHHAELRTTDCVLEGLNGSCGHAKVGPGQPWLHRPSFPLSLTGPQSFSFSFTVCPHTQPATLTIHSLSGIILPSEIQFMGFL